MEYMNRIFFWRRNISDQAEHIDLLLVCPHLGDGGVQRVVSILANAWTHKGKQIGIVTVYDKEAIYELDSGVRLFPLSDSPLARLFERIKNSYSRYLKPTIVFLRSIFPMPKSAGEGWLNRFTKALIILFAPGFYLPFFIRSRFVRSVIKQSGTQNVIAFCGSTNIIAVLACRSLPCKVIISERNDPARQKLEPPWDYFRPVYYGQADIVTANSHGALDTMRAYVDPAKLVFVPNPVLSNDAMTCSTEEVVLSEPTILIVGRLHPQKAHDVLFDALVRSGPELTGWKLSIVGSGGQEQVLRDSVESLGLAERVTWHGYVRNPFPYYRQAQIFVLPSRNEGMPNALLEAMSCGMAVVISDASPGPLELVENGVNGIVVPVNDPVQLAQALERLAANPDLRTKLGMSAKARSEEYSLPRALSTWESLIG